jgi:small conductance mechanosensitive channel
MDPQRLSELLVTYGSRAVGVLILLFVAWVVAGAVGRMVARGVGRAKVDETLTKFLAKFAKWLILLLAVLGCLGVFDVQTTSFAAVIGAAGLAIGLAFQGTLSNFSAGTMLPIFRPFKVGDVINVGGQLGKVDEIELFTTTLDTPDNRRIILPNSSIFGSTIENLTHHPIRRVDVAVGVSYSADIDETREVLTKAARSVSGGLADPEPAVVLLELGGSSVDWTVRVWANTPEFWDVKQATTGAVKRALDEAGIEIPFPQMDVHLDQPSTSAVGR